MSEEKYLIGDNTMEKVFRPAGLTNVSDLQAVFDAVEKALTPAPLNQLRGAVSIPKQAVIDALAEFQRSQKVNPEYDLIDHLQNAMAQVWPAPAERVMGHPYGPADGQCKVCGRGAGYLAHSLPAPQLRVSEPKRWLIEWTLPSGSVRWQVVEHEHDARTFHSGQPANPKVTPLYDHPAPAEHVQVGEDWAATWHKTIQTMCVLLCINGNGSPEEILSELQQRLSGQADRLKAALGREGVYIHDATAERAIRAALATATEGSGE